MKKARDVLNALRETLDHPEELGVSKETGIVGDEFLRGSILGSILWR